MTFVCMVPPGASDEIFAVFSFDSWPVLASRHLPRLTFFFSHGGGRTGLRVCRSESFVGESERASIGRATSHLPVVMKEEYRIKRNGVESSESCSACAVEET